MLAFCARRRERIRELCILGYGHPIALRSGVRGTAERIRRYSSQTATVNFLYPNLTFRRHPPTRPSNGGRALHRVIAEGYLAGKAGC